MGQKVALGGDRLGSGKKRDLELHNYYRSTHNLSQDWASSLAPGILYPFLCLPAMRGDKFEIDLEAAARTIPTQGPLFGSFKMQLDVFECDIRLYQALLHNNPLAIGLKADQVKLPTITFETEVWKRDNKAGQLAKSCLAKYLGISGIGRPLFTPNSTNHSIKRDFNAIPFLAYYDIFKNYYANKQEEKAYAITVKETQETQTPFIEVENAFNSSYLPLTRNTNLDSNAQWTYYVDAENECIIEVELAPNINVEQNTKINFYSDHSSEDLISDKTIKDLIDSNFATEIKRNAVSKSKYFKLDLAALRLELNGNIEWIDIVPELNAEYYQQSFVLEEFNLSNIDDMRYDLLGYAHLGTAFNINTEANYAPYSYLYSTTQDGRSYSEFSHNGLLVKTYQSDIFNNWVDSEWINGTNGIAAITAVTTDASGKFTIDALNLQEKLYNMLNRVAVSGGTYEDWLSAVYEDSKGRHIESPIYCGGMSTEIVFEEIVQTAPAGEGENASELGTLGGRGTLIKRKGGNVTIKCDQPAFIIGIVSITPRLYYTQGNEFYMTDLHSINDLHKPALDGIGFQDLMCEQMAWWTTVISSGGTVAGRKSAGKVPAWSHYMTAVNKAYGDFAMEEGKSFMILSRDYTQSGTYIDDMSTYIDPRKFNYAFAYTELDAQNFWVQIRSTINARRLMSAKQIPNI